MCHYNFNVCDISLSFPLRASDTFTRIKKHQKLNFICILETTFPSIIYLFIYLVTKNQNCMEYMNIG